MSKILVMGATGTIGSEVVKSLAKQSVVIKAAVHQSKNTAMLDKLGAEIVNLDITRADTFKTAFKDVEKLFLLPPKGNVELTFVKNIIDYAAQLPVKKIVFLSMMQAENYKNSTHSFIENYLQEKNIIHINIRPNFFMQNFNTYYLNHINQKKLINIYDAGVPTSFIDARDIGAVIATCLLKDEFAAKTFTLTGSTGLTHAQVADVLYNVSGQTIRYTAKSDQDTRNTLRDCGWTEEGIDTFFPLFVGVRQGDFSPVHGSVTDILERPAVSFQQYAEDYKHFWQ